MEAAAAATTTTKITAAAAAAAAAATTNVVWWHLSKVPAIAAVTHKSNHARTRARINTVALRRTKFTLMPIT